MEDFNLHCYETKIKIKTKTVLTNQTTFQRFWLAAKSKTQKNLVSTVSVWTNKLGIQIETPNMYVVK